MITGAIKEEVMFRSQLDVIEQSVRDCAVRSRLPLALGGAAVAGTMIEVFGTVGCLLILGVYANFCFDTPVVFMQGCACVVLSSWQVKNARQDSTRKSSGPVVYRKRVPRAGKQLAGSPDYRSHHSRHHCRALSLSRRGTTRKKVKKSLLKLGQTVTWRENTRQAGGNST